MLEECAWANPDTCIRPLTHASVDRASQAESVGSNSLVSILIAICCSPNFISENLVGKSSLLEIPRKIHFNIKKWNSRKLVSVSMNKTRFRFHERNLFQFPCTKLVSVSMYGNSFQFPYTETHFSFHIRKLISVSISI